jgi:hypothetical protein
MTPRLATCSVLAALALGGQARADHWIDMPAWPKPTPAVAHLRWVLQPAPPAGEGELPKRPVTLEVEADGITRAVVLDPQVGELLRDYLPLCTAAGGSNAFPLGKGEVAELTFSEAGYGGFIVKRSGDALTIIRWDLEDGACPGKHGEPTMCPRRDKQVAKLHVPAKLKLDEAIVEVDAKGNRTPLDCKALR